MNPTKTSKNERASALVAVILTIAILSLLAGVVVSNVNNRRMTLSQASAWQEALVAAEAGAHQGIAQVEQGLFQNSLVSSPPTGGTKTLSHGGEGSTAAYASYTVDPPVTMGNQSYYRIVSTGRVDLPGGKSLSMDSRDAVLRKLNLRADPNLGLPRTATRRVEAWLQPILSSTASMGLRADSWIHATSYQLKIDSFSSADPKAGAPIRYATKTDPITGVTYRVPPDVIGFYNSAPYNIFGANISTNSPDFFGGNGAGGIEVFGDLYTKGGTSETVAGTQNIYGNTYDDYYEEMAPVYAPTGTFTSGITVTTTNNGGQTKTTSGVRRVISSATITGGTKDSPARYAVDSITLNGSGDHVTFDKGATVPVGETSYVELYVKDGVSTTGGGSGPGAFIIKQGVTVKMYVGGDLKFLGNSLTNESNTAASLSIYGINPPTGTSQTFTLDGTSTFVGTVYAPGAALFLGGTGDFVGSLAGKTATLKGNVRIRYDESLGNVAETTITGFKLAAWFEDARSTEANRLRPF